MAPNVLVVLSDQQRPDSCGVYGQELPVTPRLDELASNGVAFDRAFTVQPLCGPARAALQTGRLPTEVGCWRNNLALPSDASTLASRLGDAGYWTGYVGKWHLASDIGARSGRPTARFARRPVPPERRGGYAEGWVAVDSLEHTSMPTSGHLFDADGERVPLRGYRVDALTDVVIDEFARRRERNPARPFLQFVSFLEPHHQNNRFRTIGPKGWARRFRNYRVPPDLAGTIGDWRWNYADYLACCASIDLNLGRLLDDLDRHGELDDTVVVYTSDHGSHFRTRNLEYKRSCHDASIRVPLVISGPGFDPGTRRDALVSHLDLVPTVLRAAALPSDPTLPGAALQGANVLGERREEILIQISESQIGRALRTRRYTLAVKAKRRGPWAGHRDASAPSYSPTHLYDNDSDPGQRRNLLKVGDHEAVLRELIDRLEAAIERNEGTRPHISTEL